MQAKITQILFPNITWSYINNFRLERAMNQVSEEPEDDNVNDRGDLEARPYQVFFYFLYRRRFKRVNTINTALLSYRVKGKKNQEPSLKPLDINSPKGQYWGKQNFEIGVVEPYLAGPCKNLIFCHFQVTF